MGGLLSATLSNICMVKMENKKFYKHNVDGIINRHKKVLRDTFFKDVYNYDQDIKQQKHKIFLYKTACHVRVSEWIYTL